MMKILWTNHVGSISQYQDHKVKFKNMLLANENILNTVCDTGIKLDTSILIFLQQALSFTLHI